jgi:hypothetical protein
MTRVILTVAVLASSAAAVAAQQVDPAICPLHAGHTRLAAPTGQGGHAGHAALETRGAKTMGFDQSRASHHFTLLPDGGRIEIHVNSAADTGTRQQIVSHLQDIAVRFQGGDFAIPFETHAGAPDGVDVMKRLKGDITYTFEPSPSGGGVTISTRNKEALSAVHAFLRYQIREHRTGDSTAISR